MLHLLRAESVTNIPLDIAYYWLGMLATAISVIIMDLCERASVSLCFCTLFFFEKAKEKTFLFLVTMLSCKRGHRNKDALACPHRKQLGVLPTTSL